MANKSYSKELKNIYVPIIFVIGIGHYLFLSLFIISVDSKCYRATLPLSLPSYSICSCYSSDEMTFRQVCPNIPWGDFSASVMTSEMGWLTLEGYMSLWTLNLFLYPEYTLEYLGYLGYNSDTRGNQLSAVHGKYLTSHILIITIVYCN